MFVMTNVSDNVDVVCRDNHPVDILVTTNHMVETDKLQSEVGACVGTWRWWVVLSYFHPV